jgi:alpha-tubulin suppressor-like RCC1 family protein
MYCWGSNRWEMLGTKTSTQLPGGAFAALKPVRVEIRERIKQISVGWLHTCALLESQKLRCFGLKSHVQDLAFGMHDVDFGQPVTRIASGSFHNCALLEDGELRCWGLLGAKWRQSRKAVTRNDIETHVVDGAPYAALVAEGSSTCALTRTGRMRCWDWSEGVEPVVDVAVEEPGSELLDGASACLLRKSGSIACYRDSVWRPVELGGRVVRAVGTAGLGCGILQNGTVRCWGTHMRSLVIPPERLQQKPAARVLPPERGEPEKFELDLPSPAADVDLGHWHICVTLRGEGVRCAGSNDNGELGNGEYAELGTDTSWTEIAFH